MSQKNTRKSATSADEKEKTQPDSAVKDLKKKMAAAAEKEKPADKQNSDKPATDKKEKPVDKKEKPTDKKDKPTDKQNGDKKAEKQNVAAKENGDKKITEKVAGNKAAEKSADKSSEKPKEKAVDKKLEEEKGKGDSKEDKNGKPVASTKPSENGHNGASNGTQQTAERDSDSEAMVIDDELFPELAYDDSDAETDAPHADDLRSLTRRSQVKPTRTPETPRPASDKQDNLDEKGEVLPSRTPETPQPAADLQTIIEDQEESKETKVLKLKDDPTAIANERKLRSTDSPKTVTDKTVDTPQKTSDAAKKADNKTKESADKDVVKEVIVILEDCETNQEAESRKPDTNFSKSRVKVSPYRRSMRLADQTSSSIVANYTGNNTTMETDISDASFLDNTAADDSSSYISGLKHIRGRRSYKPYKEITLRSSARKAQIASEQPSRPTGTVVGRKRKQDEMEPQPAPAPAQERERERERESEREVPVGGKRSRLLDTFMSPLRRLASSTPLPARRAAPIVGINTDLPMSAPVASSSTYDPETLKTPPLAPLTTVPPSVNSLPNQSVDAKRCLIM